MRFLVDANLPEALARWLRADGHDAAHVDDVLTPPASDTDIWSVAEKDGSVVVTKDADFALRAERDHAVQIVWVRSGNLKLSIFKPWFDARQAAMIDLLSLGERVIELQ